LWTAKVSNFQSVSNRVLQPAAGSDNQTYMDGDPHFRLKALAVLGCVVGVFLFAYVAQRAWYWLKSKRRDDIETSSLSPISDSLCFVIGAVVIWLAIEALVLAISTQHLPLQPPRHAKIAEIEVGKLDPEANQLNLLFYPVDRAGRRMSDQRRPVLTSGSQFELDVELVEWRGMWAWLGEGGFYQFVSLSGVQDGFGTMPERTLLGAADLPQTVGARIFLRRPVPRQIRQVGSEGEIYNVYLDPTDNSLLVERN
jgi:hypothetical protein